ncbi:oxidoreductase [Agromyces sp. MMS17-SY077]|uniref:Oxidoreductase n=2 Tax=Agromyces seonyuensis TaxID=2662446 RepID=A0A6I4NZH9_9MICO|nr:ferredoxin reductase [Agromyces seonyuensis]MWB99726.1 oxidoreductase [Agromyces seonyuensis]
MRLTDSARSIRLDVPGWPGNLAGQHLDLRLTAEDGYQAVRSYSIASAGPGESIELGVDRVPDGEVSPYLVDDVMTGDQLEVRGPLGGWFVWHEDDPSPVQLIGGGSGVVPLIAMARAHRAAGATSRFRMLVSARTPEDVLFAPELSALDATPGDRFALDVVYTRRGPEDWPFPIGRVDRAALERTTLPVSDSPAIFVCGPTGFVETVADHLVAIGHDPDRIKTERFGGA